jgi:hypothetical protein
VGSLILTMSYGMLSRAVETSTIRKNHPWGRFRPGSWRRIRLVTETFDEQGKLTATSVARTCTTLATVDDAGITLKIEGTVDLAGKQVESGPQVVTQGWHGESTDRTATVTDLGDDTVTISGNRLPCRVEQTETQSPGGRIVTKTWYSDRVSPYVLRRESTNHDPASGEAVSQTKVEVVALSRSLRVLRRHRQAAELRVTNTHAGGMTRTTLWSSLEVPGGVVAHESEEFDAEGRLTRRSKLDLVGYAGEFVPTPLR